MIHEEKDVNEINLVNCLENDEKNELIIEHESDILDVIITVYDKEYDGTTLAIIRKIEYIGLKDNHDVYITIKDIRFNDKNAGEERKLSVEEYVLEGEQSYKYTVGKIILNNAKIYPKQLLVTPDDKQWKYFGQKDSDILYSYTGNIEGEVPTFGGALGRTQGEEIGIYEIYRGSLNVTDTNYFMKFIGEKTYTIKVFDPIERAILSHRNKGKNNWYTGPVTINAPGGFKISLDGTMWADYLYVSDKKNGRKIEEYYLRDMINNIGAISTLKSISFNLDNTPPKGIITINKKQFKEFIGEPKFTLFLKESAKINITANDNLSGLSSENITYQKVYDASHYNPAGQWNKGTSFIVHCNEKFIVYAKLIDNAGNVKIINSCGVIVYSDSELTTDSAYLNPSKDLEIPIKLNGNTIKSIKLEEYELVNDIDYIINDDTIKFKKEYLAQVIKETKIFTININPMGEEYLQGDAPATLSFIVNELHEQAEEDETSEIYNEEESKLLYVAKDECIEDNDSNEENIITSYEQTENNDINNIDSNKENIETVEDTLDNINIYDDCAEVNLSNENLSIDKTEDLSKIDPIIYATNKEIKLGEGFDPMQEITASDNIDGDITSKIKIYSNNVNASKVGVYTVVYQVTNSNNVTVTKEVEIVNSIGDLRSIEDFIRSIFFIALNRVPNKSEYSYWINELSKNKVNVRGMLKYLLRGFIYSNNMSIEIYIKCIYVIIVGIEPSEETLKGWLNMAYQLRAKRNIPLGEIKMTLLTSMMNWEGFRKRCSMMGVNY